MANCCKTIVTGLLASEDTAPISLSVCPTSKAMSSTGENTNSRQDYALEITVIRTTRVLILCALGKI